MAIAKEAPGGLHHEFWFPAPEAAGRRRAMTSVSSPALPRYDQSPAGRDPWPKAIEAMRFRRAAEKE